MTLTASPGTAARGAAEPAVDLDGVVKRFGAVTAVDGISLKIRPGEVVALLGPNGAGKTTTVDMLLGLAQPTAGKVQVYGRKPHDAVALGLVSAVMQTGGLLKDYTVEETVRLTAVLFGKPASSVSEALERAGIADIGKRMVGKCSGGQQQRLRFAMALLPDPELLILDEPMNGLDPAGMEELRLMIRALVAEGRTVVLSSHLLDEVEKTCDAIAIVDRGRVVVQGSIDELTGDADTVLVATSDDLRARALLDGRVLESVEDGLRVRATDTAAVNRRLVEAGIDVHRLEPERVSLERRFLEITSRLEVAA
jgi:ABC-2 type transport system ATP-binding protein